MKNLKFQDGRTINSVSEIYVDCEGNEVDKKVRKELFGAYLGSSKGLLKRNWRLYLRLKIGMMIEKYTDILENLERLYELLVTEEKEEIKKLLEEEAKRKAQIFGQNAK